MSPPLAWKMVLVAVAQFFAGNVQAKCHFLTLEYFISSQKCQATISLHHVIMSVCVITCTLLFSLSLFVFLINRTRWNIFLLQGPVQLKTNFCAHGSRQECYGVERKNVSVDLRTMERSNTKGLKSALICHARPVLIGQYENFFITRLTVRRMITRSNQKNMAITAVPTRIMSSRFVFSSAPGKK